MSEAVRRFHISTCTWSPGNRIAIGDSARLTWNGLRKRAVYDTTIISSSQTINYRRLRRFAAIFDRLLLSNAVASDDSVGNMPGDFHPDNVLINGDVATIIDWTTACVGNQAANNVRDNKEK